MRTSVVDCAVGAMSTVHTVRALYASWYLLVQLALHRLQRASVLRCNIALQIYGAMR
jgi:hypothetical protein